MRLYSPSSHIAIMKLTADQSEERQKRVTELVRQFFGDPTAMHKEAVDALEQFLNTRPSIEPIQPLLPADEADVRLDLAKQFQAKIKTGNAGSLMPEGQRDYLTASQACFLMLAPVEDLRRLLSRFNSEDLQDQRKLPTFLRDCEGLTKHCKFCYNYFSSYL